MKYTVPQMQYVATRRPIHLNVTTERKLRPFAAMDDVIYLAVTAKADAEQRPLKRQIPIKHQTMFASAVI